VPRPGCRSTPSRHFATTVYNLPPTRSAAQEQVLFLLGVNEKKFFGKDSSEEGLKLLERIAEHDSRYHLLLGLPPLTLEHLHKTYPVKNGRLSSSRTLEADLYGELIPLLQASALDERPKFALDRPKRTTAERILLKLTTMPREGLRVYWAWFKRNKYKDAASYEFWHKNFPVCSEAGFEQRAEHIALKALQHIVDQRAKGHSSSALLVVNNDIYALVAAVLRKELAVDAALDSSERTSQRTAQLQELTGEKFPLQPLVFHVAFIYFGLPALLLGNVLVLVEYFCREAVSTLWQSEGEDDRD